MGQHRHANTEIYQLPSKNPQSPFPRNDLKASQIQGSGRAVPSLWDGSGLFSWFFGFFWALLADVRLETLARIFRNIHAWIDLHLLLACKMGWLDFSTLRVCNCNSWRRLVPKSGTRDCSPNRLSEGPALAALDQVTLQNSDRCMGDSPGACLSLFAHDSHVHRASASVAGLAQLFSGTPVFL